ncbi:MAG: hypothetical protein GF317_06760 [Candidatus Lokiarchaeota archaeon]|nr:hypothetical protein [Candidatus Lokiarchaeota archaeon]MBD3199410.1 hypothetical protein [Candidatus Lokiarchaeota archaeon]
MGFKKLNLEELESLLTPSLIGPPVTHIKELDLLSAEEEEISEKSSLSISSELMINNIETLEYAYDKDRNLEKFDSTGSILVSNQSKKDRIWDVRVLLENYQNTNIEDNQINLGSFEPETNKKISYNLINREKLARPLMVDEKIEVMRINSENVKNLQSLLKEEQHKIVEPKEDIKNQGVIDDEEKEKDSSLMTEISEKKSLKDIKKVDPRKEKIKEIRNEMAQLKNERKKEIIQNFNSQIDEVENKINNKLEKIEDINSKFEKWKSHKGNYQEVVKDLSNELKSVQKEKKNQINSKVSELEKKRDNKIEKITETDEEKKEIETEKIEEEFKKQKETEISTIEKKYAPKLQELKQNLDEEEDNLKHSSGKFSTFKSKKKDTEKRIKKLKKSKSKLIKKKSKTLKKQLKKLSKKEKKRIKNVNEFGEEIQKPSIFERVKTVFKALFKSEKQPEKDVQKQEQEEKEEQEGPEFIEKEEDEAKLEEEKIDSPEVESSEEASEIEIFKQPRLILLYNQKNSVKFTITLENVTENIMTNIEFAKAFSDDFYNFTYDKRKFRNIDINKNRLYLTISELKPNQKVELIVFADINPDQKRVIRSGEIQVSYRLVNNVISKTKLVNAAGYSHVMHAINVKEKETEPNLWKCALIFKNNSDFDIKLNSILVTNQKKDRDFIDIEFKDKENLKIIGSGEKFISDEWELKTPKEPKFLRKLDYTITHKVEKETRVNLKYTDNVFNITDVSLEKRFDLTQIKSFEEADITNFVNIKNIGTTGVKGLYIKESIPADFIPSLDSEDYNIRTSSGKIKSNNFKLNIIPYDEDPEKEHLVEIMVNIDEERNILLEIDDFIKLTYNLKAITPQYKKYYEFPLEVFSYYPKFSEDQIEEIDEVYSVYKKLETEKLPSLEIVHKRRNLLIGKEIFPGRTTEEFGISIIVKNNSNVEIKDIKIKDTISNAFKIISSNIDYKFENDKELGTISFLIDSILSYQEKEIRYYVKKKSGEKIDYAELESYIFG